MNLPPPDPLPPGFPPNGSDLLRITLLALSLALASPAMEQTVTGGAGNTGVTPPASVGGVTRGERDLGTSPVTRGNEANPSNSPIPGTTPGVNIGGTNTSGPPGTGGAAGGPSLGR